MSNTESRSPSSEAFAEIRQSEYTGPLRPKQKYREEMTMKKTLRKLTSLLLVAALAIPLAACGASGGESEAAPASEAPAAEASAPAQDASEDAQEYGETLAKVYERGKIIMGVNATYAPFEFHTDIDGVDTIVGFDIELGQAIADELGVELEIQDMAFDGLLPALAAGKVDFLPGLAETEERAQNASFSIPYHRSYQTLVVRSDRADEFTADSDLAGMTIGLLKGSVQTTSFPPRFPDANVYELGKIPDLIMAVQNDKIDGVLLDQPVAILYESANSDLKVSEIGYELSTEEDPGSSVLVRKDGNEDLLEIIDSVLNRVMDDGTLWQWELDAIALMEVDEGEASSDAAEASSTAEEAPADASAESEAA